MENNFNKKNKFVENKFSENYSLDCGVDMQINKQPFYDNLKDVNMNDVIKNNYNTRNKSQLALKDTLDPYNYELPYNNTIKKDIKGQEEFIYYSPYDQGPGRGFGNLNVNNTIRYSEPSRASSEDFKMYRESEILDRFDFIDNRFTNPKNVVFPFPRSGEMTRKNMPDDDQLDSINKYNFSNQNKKIYSTPASEIDYSSNIIYEDKNYISKPKPKYNFRPKGSASVSPFSEEPNTKLINEINSQNEDQRKKQQIYLKKLEYVESVIKKLKLQYGNNLTKEIISQYLENNPPEKYIASAQRSL